MDHSSLNQAKLKLVCKMSKNHLKSLPALYFSGVLSATFAYYC